MIRYSAPPGLALLILASAPAAAQSTRCEIPTEARDIWRCQNGFVIGPENVIIRLPMAETDPEALYRAGLEAAQREDWRVAIAYFTAAHQRAHLVPRYMYNLGLAHARAGNEVAAIAWLVSYLVADSEATNRAAVWAQIAALERGAHRKIELLWTAAGSAARSLPNPNLQMRRTAYADLADAAAEAGDRERTEQFIRLMLESEGREPNPTALQQQSRDHRALQAAMSDWDFAAAEFYHGQLPPGSTGIGLAQLREAPERRRIALAWPLSDSSLIDQFAGNLARTGRQQQAWEQEMIERLARRAADDTQSLSRLAAFPFLGRTDEALGVLRRLQAGDWSGEALDARLRENDEALRMAGTLEMNFDRALDAVRRYREAEGAAAALGESALYLGDVRAAEAAAGIARAIVSSALRNAPRLNRDLQAYNVAPRVETVFGWRSVRLDALLRAERGDVAGAGALLDAFISRAATGPVPSTPDIISYEAPLAWSERRHLGTYLLILFLGTRGRADDALLLASRLDSIRRSAVLDQLRLRVPEAAARFAEQGEAGGQSVAPTSPALARTLLDLIVTGRSLSAAATDLSNLQARIQSQRNPHQQVRSFGWNARDLARDLRRVRSAYQRTGRTWGA